MNLPVSPKLISKIANAISIAEGYHQPGPTKDANNPGNLAEGNIGFGVVQTRGPHGAPITNFPNETAGWQALSRQIYRILNGKSKYYDLNMTIAQVAITWSGDVNWGINVAKCLGVTPATTLRELIESDSDSQDAKWPNA